MNRRDFLAFVATAPVAAVAAATAGRAALPPQQDATAPVSPTLRDLRPGQYDREELRRLIDNINNAVNRGTLVRP